MAANSWMQHPVGYTINPQTNRPELTSVTDLFTNPVFVWGFTHVVLASLVTGAVVMLAVSAWYLRRGKDVDLFRRAAVVSLVVLLPASALILGVGSHLGVIAAKYTPRHSAA